MVINRDIAKIPVSNLILSAKEYEDVLNGETARFSQQHPNVPARAIRHMVEIVLAERGYNRPIVQ
jgi:hypothetical protein